MHTETKIAQGQYIRFCISMKSHHLASVATQICTSLCPEKPASLTWTLKNTAFLSLKGTEKCVGFDCFSEKIILKTHLFFSISLCVDLKEKTTIKK